MLNIYTASKPSLDSEWQALAEEWKEFNFCSQWINFNDKVSDSPTFAQFFWQMDFQDITKADILLCKASPDSHLRGALVEAGYALALSIPVIVIGEADDYGTWQYHPGVYRVKDMEEAYKLLQLMQKAKDAK